MHELDDERPIPLGRAAAAAPAHIERTRPERREPISAAVATVASAPMPAPATVADQRAPRLPADRPAFLAPTAHACSGCP